MTAILMMIEVIRVVFLTFKTRFKPPFTVQNCPKQVDTIR